MKIKNIFTRKLVKEAKEKEVNLWLEKNKCKNVKWMNKYKPSNAWDFMVYVNSKSSYNNAEVKNFRFIILIWGKQPYNNIMTEFESR